MVSSRAPEPSSLASTRTIDHEASAIQVWERPERCQTGEISGERSASGEEETRQDETAAANTHEPKSQDALAMDAVEGLHGVWGF